LSAAKRIDIRCSIFDPAELVAGCGSLINLFPAIATADLIEKESSWEPK
jgi:hypothetical protein